MNCDLSFENILGDKVTFSEGFKEVCEYRSDS